MKLLSSFRTSAFRLAIRYTLLYGVIVACVLAAFTWLIRSRVDPGLETRMLSEMSELVSLYRRGGRDQLIAGIEKALGDNRDGGEYLLLVDRDNNRLAGNILGWPGEIEIQQGENPEVSIGQIEQEILPYGSVEDDVYWPTLNREFDDGSRLLLAHRVAQSHDLQELSSYLSEFFIAAMTLSLLIGFSIGYSILRRLDTINHTTDKIISGNFHKRIPLSGKNDEFDVLASNLNRMLDRINQLITGFRQTTDNVAHDLRSPITRLRNRMDVTLLEPRSEEEYRQTIAQCIEEADNIIRTFNSLLEIAQAEAGNLRSEWAPVNLAEIAAETADLFAPVAKRNRQTLKLEQGAGVRISGSRHLLAQMIANLLENAINYSGPGPIRIGVSSGREHAELYIADNGPGIPEAEQERVLQRFVRLENVRNTPGNGLGLSLVNAVAHLHGADLIFTHLNPGFEVRIRFPLT